MRDPEDDEPRRPECVQVLRKPLWRAWGPKLQSLGVRCELCAEMPQADAVLKILAQQARRTRLSADEAGERADEAAEVPQEADEIWQADVRKMSMWITDAGPPRRPWSLLVTCRNNELIVHQELCLEEPDPAALGRGLLAAILAPLVGPAHRPGVVEVASEVVRVALAPQLAPLDIECVVCEELDQLDHVFLEMDRKLSEPDGMPALIDTPGVTERHVAGFFAGAAEYYREAPWRTVPGDQPIQVRCDGFQTNQWYAVVMGQSGMTLGLALYEELQVLQAILREDEDATRRHSGLSVIFSEAFEISVRDLDAAEQNGWPVAGPEAYPLAFRVNPGMAVRPPLAWELELAEACLRALPAYLQRPERTPARMTVPVASRELTLELAWLKDGPDGD
jgi:hypothetical protein